MPLHPQCRIILDELAGQAGKPLEQMTATEARASRLRRQQATVEWAGPARDVERVEDRRIDSIPVRIYWPTTKRALPVLVFYHGGGWVLGNLDLVDRPCRALACEADCIVVSVDYRLAPEHKFPAGVEDAYRAARYVAEHAGELGADPARIAVGGDSAGANLAAVTALIARESGPELAFQLLIYPVTDYTDDRPSLREYANGHLLTRNGLEWFWRNYLSRAEEGLHPHASPIQAASLSGLPPAMVITAECDPIRDQGEAYAHKLRAAGNAVELRRYAGAIHAFFQMSGRVDAGALAVADAARALRAAFSSQGVAKQSGAPGVADPEAYQHDR